MVSALTDLKARAAIYLRIKRAELGNFGEYKVLGEGVSEMKVDVGPGYRVYFARESRVTYLLLCGGDKPTRGVWKAIKGRACLTAQPSGLRWNSLNGGPGGSRTHGVLSEADYESAACNQHGVRPIAHD